MRRRSGRRTDWKGSCGYNHVAGGGTTAATWTKLLDFNAGELANWVAPTLVRIRGSVNYDPDVAPITLAAQPWSASAAIIALSPNVNTALINFNPGGNGWHHEDVLWTWMFHGTYNAQIIAGADSEMLGMEMNFIQSHEVDVRAKRLMESRGDLWIVNQTWGIHGSGEIGGNLYWGLRCLLME
jgi:hypothetical protein